MRPRNTLLQAKHTHLVPVAGARVHGCTGARDESVKSKKDKRKESEREKEQSKQTREKERGAN